MRRVFAVFAFIASLLAASPAALAKVSIDIDLSSQTMHVESAAGSYDWPVSSARSGFSTPRGAYRPQRLERMHYSKKYHNSPMPHSIFFRGGYAIHGTGAVGQLGRPASHGCIRLAPGNAATLYALVQQEGARIQISGTPPGSTRFADAPRKRHHVAGRHASRKHYASARGARKTHYAAAHRTHRAHYAAARVQRDAFGHAQPRHAAPYAYAPVQPRHRGTVRVWQAGPFGWYRY